jgi:hypothetical protein
MNSYLHFNLNETSGYTRIYLVETVELADETPE